MIDYPKGFKVAAKQDSQGFVSVSISFNLNATLRGALKDHYFSTDELSKSLQESINSEFSRMAINRLRSQLLIKEMSDTYGKDTKTVFSSTRNFLKLDITLGPLFSAICANAPQEDNIYDELAEGIQDSVFDYIGDSIKISLTN